VVIVEEGGLHRTESFTTDPIHGIQRLYRDAGTSVIFGKPSILFAEGRCVGGSTVINGGMCWRTPDRVLDDWTGGHGLPDVSPRAMEPHFARAEEILHAESQQPDTLGRHSRSSAGRSSRTAETCGAAWGSTTAASAARPARSSPCS
jgi:choline dehydrogenase-like flavoprotein